MSNGLPESLKSSSDLRWWKTDRSTSEIAERLARSHVDKEALERRLAELLEENKALKGRCTVATEELAEERHRLKGQIADLRSQVKAALERPPQTASLSRDEFERKLQLLRVELNREREQHARQVKDLKQKIAGCICGEFRIEHIPQTDTPSSGPPDRWVIRNSR